MVQRDRGFTTVRIELDRIWEGDNGAVVVVLPGPENNPALLARWEQLVEGIVEQDRDAARAAIVCRARKIWGRLGGLLKRALWAQAWRSANLVPTYVHRFVKKWVPQPGSSAPRRRGARQAGGH